LDADKSRRHKRLLLERPTRKNATERWPPSLPQLQWESRVKNSTTTEMKSTKIVIGGENFADGRQKARKQKVP
jgi:hypothetical protein